MSTSAPAPALPAPTLPVPRGRDVAAGFGLGLVAPVLVMVGFLVAADRLGLMSSTVAAVAVLLGGALMVCGTWGAVRWARWRWADVGYRWGRRSLAHLLWAIPTAMVASVVFAMLLGSLLSVAPSAEGNTDTVGLFSASPLLLVVGGLFIVVVIPAVEEVLFRRLLLDWLRSRMPTALAVGVASAAFAAVHILPAAMLYLFPMAVAMALLRIRLGTLWAPALLHMVNNGLVFAATLSLL